LKDEPKHSFNQVPLFVSHTLTSYNADDFELALELMKDWRIDRFYIGKAKAFDTATHAKNLS